METPLPELRLWHLITISRFTPSNLIGFIFAIPTAIPQANPATLATVILSLN